MSKNLLQLKKDLKAFAKRCKDFKYTDSALFMFLLCGLLSINLFSATVSDSSIESQVHQINASINQARANFKRVRRENDKLLKGTTIELMQLMEQGDQVVKSSWSSWQYGMDFFSNSYNGSYKGEGDKVSKYDEQGGKLNRGNCWETTISAQSDKYTTLGKSKNNQISISNSRNGYLTDEWGLVKLKGDIQEPIIGIELSANVKPKNVNAIPVPNVAVPNIPQAPSPIAIEPNIPIPPKAPVIEVPVVQPIAITPASAPNITAPSLTQLTINLPSKPTVTPPTLGTFTTPAVGTIMSSISGSNNQYREYNNTAALTVASGNAGVGYLPNGTNSNIKTPNLNPGGEAFYSSKNQYGGPTQQSRVMINNSGTLTVSGDNAVGFFLQPDTDKDPGEKGTTYNTTIGKSTYGDRDNLIEYAFNNGTIDVTGNNSFGMLAGKNGDNRFGVSDNENGVASSSMNNNMAGVINVTGANNSAGFAVLQEIYAGNQGTINVNNSTLSAGFYSNQPANNIGRGQTTPNLGNYNTTSTTVNYGSINIGSSSSQSAAFWLENGGYGDERGRVSVTADKNLGLVAKNGSTLVELNDFAALTVGIKTANYDNQAGVFIKSKDSIGAYADGNSHITVHGNGVFIGVDRGFGSFGSNNATVFTNPDVDTRTADAVTTSSNVASITNSIGVYLNHSNLDIGDVSNWWTERDYGRIITEGSQNHAVVAENGSTINSYGLIQNNALNTAVGTIGVYLNNSKLTMQNAGAVTVAGGIDTNTGQVNATRANARIISGNGSVNIYAMNNSAATITSGVLQVGDTLGNNTAINVYKDANSTLTLGGGNLSMVTGNNGVGIFTTDFSNVAINTGTTSKLGNGAVFSYLQGGTAKSSQYNNLKIDSSSSNNNTTLIYTVDGNTFTFDTDMNLKTFDGHTMNVYSINNAAVENAAGNTMNQQDNNNNMLVAASNPNAVGNGNPSTTKATNYGILNQNASAGASIYTLYGTATNASGGTINLNQSNTAGVFGDESSIVVNDGTINITSAATNSVGLYGRDDNTSFNYGTDINISNSSSGTINVDATNSIGISADNTSKTAANSTISNIGTINVKGSNGIGIYTPYSTVNSVGTVDLSGVTRGDNAVAVYAEKQNSVDTSTGKINLGTANGQTQVAYYLKGDGTAANDPTINASSNLGTITGHGVGMLVDDIVINNSNFVSGMGNNLDYTSGTGNTGDGIIGLYLTGAVTNANNLDYTGDIKVGKSVTSGSNTDYAVALYSYKQGTSTAPVTVHNNLEVGERGVGLFAANDSNLVYDTGAITVNTNGTGGTGIYVSEPTATGNTSKVHLKSDIITNGDNAAGAIVGQNGQFTFDSAAKMTFNGSGVAMYGFKDSIIEDLGGTILNPTGSSVERIRTHGGRLDVLSGVTMLLPSGQILYHSENGQVNNDPTATINDGAAAGNGQIALYAEGHLDPSQTPYTNSTVPNAGSWNAANYDSRKYDGINQGTIDLNASTTAVAIYANSADTINDTGASIKMGDSSVAMYGINNANNSTTHGGTSSLGGNYTTNVVNAGDITAGKNSVGIFGDGEYTDSAGVLQNSGAKGADSLTNAGNITVNAGANEAVGIYRRGNNNGGNTKISNSGTIDLGAANGTVGIYGTTSTVASPSTITPANGSGATKTGGNYTNVITNTGTIKVGNTIPASSSSTGKEIRTVGIYAQNSSVDNNGGTIEVGNDGIVFVGDNSDITINGNIINPNGILAYGNNETTIDYQLGTGATTSNEPLMYLLNGSTANMQGQDVNVAANTTGVYLSGTGGTTGRSSSFDDFGTMTLGQNSNGLYGTGGATLTVGSNSTITSSQSNATGIIADDTNVVNNGTVNLAGSSSLGIYSANSGASRTSVANNGTGVITLGGENSVGVYANGADQTVTNDGIINVGAATSSTTINLGIYGDSDTVINNNAININNKGVGIYSTNTSGLVTLTSNSILNVMGDEATGLYKDGGTVDVAGTVNITGKGSIGIYGTQGAAITDNTGAGTIFNVGGSDSFGVVIEGTGTNYTSSALSNVTLGSDAIYVYGNTVGGTITNNAVVNTVGDRNMALYGGNSETIKNNANLNLQNGKGNIGIFTIGGNAENNTVGVITVGDADTGTAITYAIGMASQNGTITNNGDINLNGNLGIGMYANGKGSSTTYDAVNNGNIYLNPLTTGTPVTRQVGMYLENGARGINYGYIGTNGVNYTGNTNVKNLVGVAVLGTSTFENYGTVEIDADKSSGIIVRGNSPTAPAIIKNYGTIKISGDKSAGVSYTAASAAGYTGNLLDSGNEAIEVNGGVGVVIESNGAVKYSQESNGSKSIADVTFETDPATGLMVIKRNGVNINAATYTPTVTASSNIGFSNVGVYVDTLGNTKPIDMSGYSNASAFAGSFDLILGAEIAQTTNNKNILVQGDVINRFNNWLGSLASGTATANIYSGSLTWTATVASTGTNVNQLAMAKIPYTFFVEPTDNAWNFADGLEQRYGVESLNSREKQVFNKLNSIGNNEAELLSQAYDEMMGHQYANVQQRIQQTNDILSYEFDHMKGDWKTVTKDSNKIKMFGTSGEYKSDTAGIINTKNKAYGAVYLHENEGVRVGDRTGWYLGAVHNKFDFDDLGGSKEETTLAKIGIYKSIPFDYNNSLNWTISGDVFVARSEMNRKFLVVDEIFGAKADYNSYGFSIKNEIGKEFRVGENTSIKPYGALKFEYGRTENIKEENGEIRLEVDRNDYYSIKPEVGVQLNQKYSLGTKVKLNLSLGAAYENELGKVGDTDNKAKVRYTTADYFDIRGEKENRRGNGKLDLSIGVNTARLGVTVNAGYDTNGKNFRSGIGFRAIY